MMCQRGVILSSIKFIRMINVNTRRISDFALLRYRQIKLCFYLDLQTSAWEVNLAYDGKTRESFICMFSQVSMSVDEKSYHT